MRRGCLALLAAALVIATVAFGTGALYLELHRPGSPHAGRLVLLILVLLIPLAGAAYLMYLDFRSPHR